MILLAINKAHAKPRLANTMSKSSTFDSFDLKSMLISPEQALLGREQAFSVNHFHYVHGRPIKPPFPDGLEQWVFGMGCFWGAERLFWQIEGVYSTAAGYAGGYTPNPTYKEVCSGRTAHTEVVLVVFDSWQVSAEHLLNQFWENHNPTQGMRQGNDRGTQYRSAIYTQNAEQQQQAQESYISYQQRLNAMGHGQISTEIKLLEQFYYAEQDHQQYLHKNPTGYCGLKGLGY